MKNSFFYFLFFCLAACHSSTDNSSTEKSKVDSVDYIITENFKFWLSTLKPNGDTGNIYLRELIFENKSSQSIYLPIYDQPKTDIPIFSANHSLDAQIISPCITCSYKFNSDSSKSGQWASNSDCPIFHSRKEMKANSKSSFYIIDSPNDLQLHADSFVFKIDYWNDTLDERKKYSIIKNLYSSNKKLIAIEKFKSL